MRQVRWKAALATVIAGMLSPWTDSVSAQLMPIPDDTLGEESSTLGLIAPDYPGDVIEGGSRRGNTLFHSFEEFHVEAGRAVYFADPGVDSILGRVTGETESQILGLLGVFGDADLFLINPNGIIFGENARLDLKGGSFLVTTADSVEFNGSAGFDTDDAGLPTAPTLTVQPSAFLFNRANPAAIVNNSRILLPTGLDDPPGGGLRVADGERITLLGGDVSMDNGGLSALGGRVEVGGLSESGTVGFNIDGSLAFPTGVGRSDVSIANGSRLVASDSTVSGGSVAVTANLLEITNRSAVSAGTVGGTRFAEGQAGDITLDASSIRVVNAVVDNIIRGSRGNGGDVLITADELLVSRGSNVQSTLLGEGRSGRIKVDARERVVVDNGVFFSTLGGADRTVIAAGEAGNIEVTAPIVVLTNGSQLQSGTFGRGNGGNIIINASERATFENIAIFSGVLVNFAGTPATGDGGNIQITTPSLSLTDESELSSRTSGRGNGGNIQIVAGSLSLAADSALVTNSSGQGSAGDVSIKTQGRTVFDQSYIISDLGQTSESARMIDGTTNARRAGDIEITADSLDLLSGAQLQSDTSGQGDAGNVTIRTRDRLSIEGARADIPAVFSAIFASNSAAAQGQGGQVSINAGSVRIADGGIVSTNTFNRFPGGTVTIDANTLEILGGGQVATGTSGDGRAGDINLNIAERTTIRGSNAVNIDDNQPFFSGLFADTTQNSTGGGGTVRLSTLELQVLDQARIEVNSQGSGAAGDMVIAARTVRLDNGRLTAETAAVNGGNIALKDLELLLLRNGSLISTTAGTAGAGGNGGNIDIESGVIFSGYAENNDIRANAFSGSGGSVRIDTSGLFGIAAQPQDNLLTNDITASSEQGIQGTVEIVTPKTDPRSGITELPVAFTDASNQITQTCAGNSDGQSSEFIVTGRGGLPPSPTDALVGDAPSVEWAVLDEPIKTSHSRETPSNILSDSTFSTEEIIEAQGWIRENGKVELVAVAPTSVVQKVSACR